MYGTEDMDSDFINIAVEQDGMRTRLEKGEVGAAITNIMEDQEVLDYFDRILVQSVRLCSREFLTKRGRDYFNYITQRNSMLENFKLNLESNLLANALNTWFRLPYYSSLESVMLKILDVDFAKKVIDVLVGAFETVKERLQKEELEAFADGSDFKLKS